VGPRLVVRQRDCYSQTPLDRTEQDVPGFFLYFPSRARSSPPQRLFIEAAKELAVRAVT
jgi:hypothetical protein